MLLYDYKNTYYYMSTKNQNRKDDKDDVTQPPSTEQQFQREQQQAVNKVLDETRDNIKKTTNEARKEIPRYTQIVNDYEIICYNLFSIFGKTILKSPKLGTLIKNIANCLT